MDIIAGRAPPLARAGSLPDYYLCAFPLGHMLLHCHNVDETCLAAGAEVDFLNVAQAGFDLLAEIKKKERPNTKAMVLNLPHNPTGYASGSIPGSIRTAQCRLSPLNR